MGKRKVFWALERKQWMMQGKRNVRKERRKKRMRDLGAGLIA